MPISQQEIIDDVEGQIRKSHGAWVEWSVGTAKDSRGPFFQRHREADLGDGLAYREAYTTTAAEAVVAGWRIHRRSMYAPRHTALVIDCADAAAPIEKSRKVFP